MNRLKIFFFGLLAFLFAAFIGFVIFLLIGSMHEPEIFIIIIISVSAFNAIIMFILFNSSRQVNIKLCWIFVMGALPLFGTLIYLIFGTCPYDKKTWKAAKEYTKSYNRYEDYEFTKKFESGDKNIDQIFKYNFNISQSPIYEKNSIRIIKDLTSLFDESINLIRSAKKTIHLSTYIFKDGVWSRCIVTELIKKAQEGVQVRFMYDWVGCYNRLPKKLIKQLKEAKIEVAIFNPKGFNMFKSVTNYRSHRKVILVDNRAAIYGGSNIADEYLSISPKTNYWRDLNFYVEGEIANSMNLLFLYDWFNFSNHAKKRYQQKDKKFINSISKILQIQPSESNQIMQLVNSAPDLEEKQIEQTLINLIKKAKNSIKIVTPYLFPTQSIIDSLSSAAMSGIKVELILPGRNDDKQTVIANRFHCTKLLSSGCKIYEYQGFIHSKYLIADDSIVFSGSNNMDYRSLWINFESALLIYNETLSKEMINVFSIDKSNSKLINLDFIKNHINIWHKIGYSLINIFHPLL